MKRIMVMLILTLLVSSTWAEVFRDDFNDGDLEEWVDWGIRGEASIETGELVLGFPPPDPAKIRVGFLGAVSKDYEVTVSVKIVDLMFPPTITNGVKIGLRAHAIDEKWEILLLQYNLSYTFLLGRHTDGRKGVGAAIWYVHKIVKRPEMDSDHFMNNVKLSEIDKKN